jgi:hypothetical protein
MKKDCIVSKWCLKISVGIFNSDTKNNVVLALKDFITTARK